MFPKPSMSHRGIMGTLTGTAGAALEQSTGLNAISTQPTFTQNDALDVVEYEYWNGSAWVTIANFAAILARTYVQGFQWRVRITNSYFGVTGSWITSSASVARATGGSSAFASYLAGVSVNKTVWYDGSRMNCNITSIDSELLSPGGYPGNLVATWTGNLRHVSYPTIPDIVGGVSATLVPDNATEDMSQTMATYTSAGYNPIGSWSFSLVWTYTYPNGTVVSDTLTTDTFTP